MADKHLSAKPSGLTTSADREGSEGHRDWWWYEEPDGIQVYYGPEGRHAVHAVIPWKDIRAALNRKEKP